jgi:hypothetical protein
MAKCAPDQRHVQASGPSGYSNMNNSNDVVDSQRSHTRPERPADQYLTASRIPEGPPKLEISKPSSLAVSNSENRDRHVMAANLEQRPVFSSAQQPSIIAIEVKNSTRNISSKQSGAHIPPHYNTNIANSSAKVEYTEPLPPFPHPKPKEVHQVTHTGGQIFSGDSQTARVPPTLLQLSMDRPSTESQPNPRKRESPIVGVVPFVEESPDIGKLNKLPNKDDVRQNVRQIF